jgi:hypothetical protein
VAVEHRHLGAQHAAEFQAHLLPATQPVDEHRLRQKVQHASRGYGAYPEIVVFQGAQPRFKSAQFQKDVTPDHERLRHGSCVVQGIGKRDQPALAASPVLLSPIRRDHRQSAPHGLAFRVAPEISYLTLQLVGQKEIVVIQECQPVPTGVPGPEVPGSA